MESTTKKITPSLAAALFATTELRVETLSKSGMGTAALDSTPIRSEWILSGRPTARSKLVAASDDGASSSFIWECTAGRFNWHYSAEETIYFLEGNVIIKDNNGVTHRLGAGDTIFFPRGAVAEWQIDQYIRKVAFVRSPMPKSVMLLKRMLKFLKHPLSGRGSLSVAQPAMFSSSHVPDRVAMRPRPVYRG